MSLIEIHYLVSGYVNKYISVDYVVDSMFDKFPRGYLATLFDIMT
jgi:hypothetical protein